MLALHDGAPLSAGDLEVRLGEVVDQARFATVGRGTLTSRQMQEAFLSEIPFPSTPVLSAELHVPEAILAGLSEYLRELLEQFIADNRIGSGVAYLVGTHTSVSVDDFTSSLVRAAAILTPTRAARLLTEWINGAPVRYKANAVLWRAHFRESFDLENGIEVISLTMNPSELPNHLPVGIDSRRLGLDFLHKPKLSIMCDATPALWRPKSDRPPVEISWAGRLQGWPIHHVCEMVSLVCDKFVSWRIEWSDFGELIAFNRGFPGASSPAQSYDSAVIEASSAQLSQSDLKEAIHLLLKLRREKKGLDIAIARWRESKRPTATFSNRLIELRIALEALFLGDGNKRALGFRLATQGASYVGRDFADRKRTQNVLKKVYSKASNVVHGTPLKSPNAELLEEAQDICRRGILKRLNESKKPNWNDLILGCEIESGGTRE